MKHSKTAMMTKFRDEPGIPIYIGETLGWLTETGDIAFARKIGERRFEDEPSQAALSSHEPKALPTYGGERSGTSSAAFACTQS